MKRLFVLFVLACTLLTPSLVYADEPGQYGSLWVGPRVGGVLGIRGPRGGYNVGLELSYRTPFFMYYNFEVGFLHLLPRTVTVEATQGEDVDGEIVEIAPEHEAKLTGLYGIPVTMEVGFRFAFGRTRLRIGVGFGAMFTIQTMESQQNEVSEFIASFCFRPTLGLDIVGGSGNGLLRMDLSYLWQDAEFEMTGDDNDVSSVIFTIGYSWKVVD